MADSFSCRHLSHCALFLWLPFWWCFCVLSKAPCRPLSIHQENTAIAQLTADDFWTSEAFSAKPTLWKTSEGPKCLQLKEEAPGIIDKLPPKIQRNKEDFTPITVVPAKSVNPLHGAGYLGGEKKERTVFATLSKQQHPYDNCIALIFYLNTIDIY